MTVEMNDSHFPWMAETSSFPEDMRAFITSDLPIVPAMITVLLPERKKLRVFFSDVSSENYAPGKYGPGFNHYFHSHVFELLLRLRANYFWPAEWASMFCVDDTANQPLSDAYGVVLGSSHTGIYKLFSFHWKTTD